MRRLIFHFRHLNSGGVYYQTSDVMFLMFAIRRLIFYFRHLSSDVLFLISDNCYQTSDVCYQTSDF